MSYAINYKSIGKRLRAARNNLGLTQERIAEGAGISSSFYAHVENGSGRLGLATIIKLSLYFNISLDYLIFGKEPVVVAENTYVEKVRHQMKRLSPKGQKLFSEIMNSFERTMK